MVSNPMTPFGMEEVSTLLKASRRIIETKPSTVLNIFDLNVFIDVSDPDINLPNLHHLFQTAEAIRQDGHPEWLQLTGLLHDLGKIMYLWDNDEDGTSIKEQWAICGDTFVVGCKIPNNVVYPEFNSLRSYFFEINFAPKLLPEALKPSKAILSSLLLIFFNFNFSTYTFY